MSTNGKNELVESSLFFNGRCDEALEFYRKALGAEVGMVMRYKDSPEKAPPGMIPPGFEDKVMHSTFRVGGTTIMASDGCSTEKTSFGGFSLALTVENEAEADRAFSGLANGGKVEMPLTKTFWSPRFGMLQDRFGVGWMIMVRPPAGK